MKQKYRSRSEARGPLGGVLAARMDQAIASLGKAEIELRNLRLSHLPEMADALSAAVADVEALRGTLPTPNQGDQLTAALQAQIKRMKYAAARVSALHRAAMDFHARLMRIRLSEVAEYDAVGAVCNASEFHAPQHCLEARG